MKLFLDSADPAEIETFSRWHILDGVTTTPTFFRRLGYRDTAEVVREIATHMRGEIHLEALGRSVDDIVTAARKNRELGDNIVSKIPIGPLGIAAAGILRQEGIRVNLHLVFSVNQAVLGAKAGAAYVCPLMGRMRDAGLDAEAVISRIIEAFRLYPEFDAQLMVSSIRTVEDVECSFLMGAPVITIPPAVFRQLPDSPLTEKAHSILAADKELTEPVCTSMAGLDQLPRLDPSADAHRVMVEMTLKRVGIVALVEQDRLVGVLTDGDLRRRIADQADSRNLIARDIMTRDPVVVSPEAPLGNAMDLMRERRVNEVLVVDSDGKPCGLVSLHDLIAASGEG